MTESPIWTKDYFEKYTDTWKLNRERAMPVVPERPTIPFVTQAKTSISGSFQERGILQNVALIQKTWVELSWMIKVILKLFITNIGWTCMNILPDFRTILNISSWMIMFHDILKTCGVLTTLLMCTCKKRKLPYSNQLVRSYSKIHYQPIIYKPIPSKLSRSLWRFYPCSSSNGPSRLRDLENNKKTPGWHGGGGRAREWRVELTPLKNDFRSLADSESVPKLLETLKMIQNVANWRRKSKNPSSKVLFVLIEISSKRYKALLKPICFCWYV